MIGEVRRYLERGLAPIPLRYASKTTSLITLKPYLDRAMDLDEIEQQYWYGVGIVTGSVSGIVVLDVDGQAGAETLGDKGHPLTPMAETGGGVHLYFKHPGGHRPNAIRFLPGIDLKGDGGYVVAPPSVHPSGVQYQWVDGLTPWDVDFAPLPDWVLNELYVRGKSRDADKADQLAEPITSGGRNETLTQVAGALRARGLPRDVIYTVLASVNEEWCEPALPDGELARIAKNIGAYPAGKKRDKLPRNSRVSIDISFGDEEPPVF